MRRVRELWLVDVPALGYAIAATCGTLLGILGIVEGLAVVVIVAAVTLSIVALIFIGSHRLATLVVFASFALIVGYRANIALERDVRQRIADEYPESRACELMGRISWKEPARDDRSGYLWIGQAKLATDSGECTCGELRIRLRVPAVEWQSAEVGDVVAGSVKFVPAQQMYMSRSGLLFWSVARQHCGDAILRAAASLDTARGGGGIANSLFELREAILDILEAYLTPDARAMCGALLLGERVGFSPEFQGDLYSTGLTHLFALSGLNTGLIAALLWFVLSLLRTPLVARGFIVLAALGLYAALGVGAPSLVRSSLMAAMIVGTRLLHRKGNSANYILAAFAIELLIWPLHALDAGFLLSYLAIAGLTAGYLAFAEPLAKWFGEGKAAMMKRPAQLVGSAIGAQISTAPLTAMLFGRIPGVAVLANIIAVPGFSLLLVLTLLLIFSSFVNGIFAGWIANSIEALSFALTRVVMWPAMLPGAGFRVSAPALAILGWLFLSVGAIASLLRLRVRWAIALLLIALNGVIWSDVATRNDEPYVAYVNERSVLVGCCDAAILLGCGASWENERAGGDVMRELQARERNGLDAIVLPTDWASSTGALPGVVEAVDVGSILWSRQSDASWTATVNDAALQHIGIDAVIARVGTTLRVKNELDIRVLWPPGGIHGESAMLVEMRGGARLLLTVGDVPTEMLQDDALRLMMSRDGKLAVGDKRDVHSEWEYAGSKWKPIQSATERYANLMNLPYAS